MNSSSQSNYHNYISEIQELKIESNRFNLIVNKSKELTFEHYSQIESGYENKLKKLQQLALNDLSLLDQTQIKLIIKRLEEINERFDKFWKVYKKWFSQFEKQEFDIYDFKEKLNYYFTVQKSSLNTISQNTFFQLHDAVMFKQGSLLGFIEQVRQLIDPKKSTREGPTKQAIGLFCQLINATEIITRGGSMSKETYCKKVCERYNIHFTKKVRQHLEDGDLNIYGYSKYIREIKDIILPKIDKTTSDRITEYLDSKSKRKS